MYIYISIYIYVCVYYSTMVDIQGFLFFNRIETPSFWWWISRPPPSPHLDHLRPGRNGGGMNLILGHFLCPVNKWKAIMIMSDHNIS